jgi:ATP-dependent Clp protease ATP-binding subunit ClpA
MLTIKEASNYADRSESWVRKKILSGELKAEKKPFKYGKRWETTKKDIDDLLESAKMEKEVVEIREVKKPVAKEEFLNELEEMNKNLLENATSELNKKIDDQNKLIKELREEIRNKKSYLDQFIDFIKSKF